MGRRTLLPIVLVETGLNVSKCSMKAKEVKGKRGSPVSTEDCLLGYSERGQVTLGREI